MDLFGDHLHDEEGLELLAREDARDPAIGMDEVTGRRIVRGDDAR